jgi:hypothetical protein
MIYYYAHTGHKVGLQRARRGVAVLKKLQEAGREVQFLVNDFRAGVAMKEEQGWQEYVTIETIQDIDAIAETGDSVIIDSDEDDHGRLVKYAADFKSVLRFAHDETDRSVHGEILLRPDCQDASCLEAVIVDDIYFEGSKKEERVLFFLGDHDHHKTILSQPDFFRQFEMELLLGHYFFVKYEDALAELFGRLHEPEEYTEAITQSQTVVTAAAQTALEAKASGAKVLFIATEETPLYPLSVLEAYGIRVIEGFDAPALREALTLESPEATRALKPYTYEKISTLL